MITIGIIARDYCSALMNLRSPLAMARINIEDFSYMNVY
jgi:hypothetical protein